MKRTGFLAASLGAAAVTSSLNVPVSLLAQDGTLPTYEVGTYDVDGALIVAADPMFEPADDGNAVPAAIDGPFFVDEPILIDQTYTPATTAPVPVAAAPVAAAPVANGPIRGAVAPLGNALAPVVRPVQGVVRPLTQRTGETLQRGVGIAAELPRTILQTPARLLGR